MSSSKARAFLRRGRASWALLEIVLVSLSSAGLKTHLDPSDVWRRLRAALPVCSDFPPAGQTPTLATRPLKAHYGSITCPSPQQQLPPPSPHLHPSLSGSLFLHHDRAGPGQPRDSFAHAGHFYLKQVSHGSDPGSAVALETCNIWENRREWGGWGFLLFHVWLVICLCPSCPPALIKIS